MKPWLKVLLILISILAILACILCCLYIYQYFRGNMLSDRLNELANPGVTVVQTPEPAPQDGGGETSAPSGPEDTAPQEPTISIDIDFAALQEINPDIYAWIEVPGTVISYAVVQHPEDDLYYNNHSVDGSYYTGGSIFSQRYNSKDFGDPMTVLYGHNLQSTRMFTQLNNFADVNFFRENRLIYIYTPEKVYEYEIFAAYPHSSEHLLLCHDFSDREQFGDYFTGILSDSGVTGNFDQELFPQFGDRVLTLSTCYRQNRWQRFLVQGVLTQVYTVVPAA